MNSFLIAPDTIFLPASWMIELCEQGQWQILFKRTNLLCPHERPLPHAHAVSVIRGKQSVHAFFKLPMDSTLDTSAYTASGMFPSGCYTRVYG